MDDNITPEVANNNVVQFPKADSWNLAEIELARSRGQMAASVVVEIPSYFELLDLAEFAIITKMQNGKP